MVFECSICNSTFTTKGNLSAHKKSAKYCQNLLKEQMVVVTTTSFSCDICGKTTKTAFKHHQHYLVCSSQPGYVKMKELVITQQAQLSEKDTQMFQRDALIDKLRHDLQQLSLEAMKRPTTVMNTNTNNHTHTTNINNLAVFVKSDLVDAIEKYPITKQIMNDGVSGVAKHVGTLMKTQFEKPNYIVSNEAKQKFSYKLEDGTVQKDYKCKLIINSIAPTISDQATVIYNSTLSDYELVSKIKNIQYTKIPAIKKDLIIVEQQLEDIPKRRKENPERLRLQKIADKYNDELVLFTDELKCLQRDATLHGVRLDVPVEYYEDDMGKTSQNLKKMKNLDDHSSSFSKTFIENINGK